MTPPRRPSQKPGPGAAPNDDSDGNIDGDHPLQGGASWNWAQDLSAHDIDNDGKVELPRNNEVPVPAANEYTEAQAVRHTITHEMGHAVGTGHCNVDTCLMYHTSINWSRDGHFSNNCRGMILIHNN